MIRVVVVAYQLLSLLLLLLSAEEGWLVYVFFFKMTICMIRMIDSLERVALERIFIMIMIMMKNHLPKNRWSFVFDSCWCDCSSGFLYYSCCSSTSTFFVFGLLSPSSLMIFLCVFFFFFSYIIRRWWWPRRWWQRRRRWRQTMMMKIGVSCLSLLSLLSEDDRCTRWSYRYHHLLWRWWWWRRHSSSPSDTWSPFSAISSTDPTKAIDPLWWPNARWWFFSSAATGR